jgi:hypothetical protein
LLLSSAETTTPVQPVRRGETDMPNRNTEERKHAQDAERARQQEKKLPPEKRNERENERERKLPGKEREYSGLLGEERPGAEQRGQPGGRPGGTEKQGDQQPSPQRQGERKDQDERRERERDIDRELEEVGSGRER